MRSFVGMNIWIVYNRKCFGILIQVRGLMVSSLVGGLVVGGRVGDLVGQIVALPTVGYSVGFSVDS
jgi:hypothetical protein